MTALQAMPETYNEIVEHPDFRSARPVRPHPVRRRRAAGRRPARPGVAVAEANGYGLTETFTLCTWAEPEETGGEFRTVHGRPLPGIDLRIVDGETGEELADG